ncbi:MAG: RNA polymerase sigma factor RpoE [Burkholderiaceae bacterium]
MTTFPPPTPAPSPSPATDPVSAARPLVVDVDAALVQRAVAGEVKAFELLVIKYQRRVERLIGRMVRDVDLVPDIAQETFIRAYRAMANFRGESQFYTWLYRIAVNTAKKHLLDLKRNPVVVMSALNSGDDDETSSHDHEPSWAAHDTETPEAVLASKEIAQAVNAVMDALPEELRQAITLREIEGLSYEDIAQALECPIGTVRSRIFRAREAISARIKPMLDRQTGKRW